MRAVAIYKAKFGDQNIGTAVTKSNLANVYLKQNETKRAEPLFQESVITLSKLPAGNNLVGIARGRWGRALLHERRYSEAREQLELASKTVAAQADLPADEIDHIKEDTEAVCQHIACTRDNSGR